MYIEILKEMFTEMVSKKNADAIPTYYHPDFFLYCNNATMDYKKFLEDHIQFYATPIQYKIEYDEDTLIEQGDKIAGRIFITLSKPNVTPKKLEVMMIAQFKDNKIYRVWELTYPDWATLPEFE